MARRRFRPARLLGWLLFLMLAAVGALLLWAHAREHPENLPWTALDLTRPIGAFTGRKLVALADDPALCRALLDRAGASYTALPPRTGDGQCGYREAVRLRTEGALDIIYRPAGLATSCPVAAALALWEWHVVQPAALRHFGRKVASIDHFGSYSCRRMYGREEGAWSEHSSANAADIAGFRLEGGERITIVGDWTGDAPKAAFLREVRDGACDLFATVLSPEYNADHRDHLHLDQAARGSMGWRACR